MDTPGGTRVGTIGDVLLDEEAHIVGFHLARVLVEGPIAEHPTITRAAMVDTGGVDGVMTINLATAEQHSQTALTEPETLEAEPAAPVEEAAPAEPLPEKEAPAEEEE